MTELLFVPFVWVCVLGHPDTCTAYTWEEQATPERTICMYTARIMLPFAIHDFLEDYPGEQTSGGIGCDTWKGEQV